MYIDPMTAILSLQGTAVSAEARHLSERAEAFVGVADDAQSLGGPEAAILGGIRQLAAERGRDRAIEEGLGAFSWGAYAQAERFIRLLPKHFPLPDASLDPDGAIALGWFESNGKAVSLSIGESPRLALAWIYGSETGHAVSLFEGRAIPRLILERLEQVIQSGRTAVRTA